MGSLSGDIRSVAKAVVHACRRRMLVVWVDHENSVFGDIPSQVSHAPPDWIVGTYRACEDDQVIRDDLLQFVASRGVAPELEPGGSAAQGEYA